MQVTDTEEVVVDGKHLGRTFNDFRLHSLIAAMLGGDRFDEVFIETHSGNIYAIYENERGGQRRTQGLDCDYGWVLVNMHTNRGRGEQAERYFFTKDELENGELIVGYNFRYGNEDCINPIVLITCVQTQRTHTRERLRRVRKNSQIRSRFIRGIGSRGLP